jgi:pyruvate formate lyase activating enzyme
VLPNFENYFQDHILIIQFSGVLMAIHKITYSKEFKRANLHNYGCNFNCSWCLYKLEGKARPNKFLKLDEIRKVLSELDMERAHFVGGEITTCSQLSQITDFTKNELGVYTKIGHSNGFNLPPKSIDAISMSIKSLSEDFYQKYTGKSNKTVLENFKTIYRWGAEIDASSVYIPGLVEADEISRIAEFIAKIDPEIKYHITGYVPVPGVSWRSPTYDEIIQGKHAAEKYLEKVNLSWFPSSDEYTKMIQKSPEYQKITVA